MRKVTESLLTGLLVWLIVIAWLRPSLFQLQWGVSLLLFASLVIVPLGLQIISDADLSANQARLLQWISLVRLPAALLLIVAFAFPAGWLAATFALPWLIVTLLIALAGCQQVWQRGISFSEKLCLDAGMIYLSVGGVWLVLSRYGARPLGFDPVIVLLTAIHFHYAGFALPLLTGLAARERNDFVARMATVGVIVGVPLTAIGITTSQLGWAKWPETIAALLTALAGLLTAFLYFRLSRQNTHARFVRGLWLLTAFSLAFSMTLAAMYGLRHYAPMPWLDIPLMRALHGTANSLGFAFAGLLAWAQVGRKRGKGEKEMNF